MNETALPLPPPQEDADRPTFDALPLSPEIRRAVDDLGFVHPSPVQLAVFQPAVSGADLVVQARTGTGKTAAFGLPLVDRLVDPRVSGPQVLVLAPTRELALQISRELGNLTKHKPISCVAIYGGAAMQPQIDALRAGAQIIVGTPGRVLDHFERGTLTRGGLRILVLDESDEMLSMGFLPQITRIMEYLPRERQTLLFSATLPPDVRRIAETRLKEPVFITLSGDHVGALSIQHFVYRSRGAKPDELVQVIAAESPESAIVFCNTRDQTKRIASALKRAGYTADWLNADLAQNDREKVMHATREGKLRFLVATDVAARGIDISHLTHVINADFPESTENYVHRTGRTGRAGRTGTAISLIAPQDVGNLYMLRLTYKIFPIERELPSLRELSSRREADLVSSLADQFDVSVRPEDLSLARRVLQSDAAEIIVAGLLAERQALAALPVLAAGSTLAAGSALVAAPALAAVPGGQTSARHEFRSRDAESALDDDRKKHKKDKKKDRKRKDRSEDEDVRRDRAPEAESAHASDQHPHGPGLEIVSASQILGGSVEQLLDDDGHAERTGYRATPGRTEGARNDAVRSDAVRSDAVRNDAARSDGARQERAGQDRSDAGEAPRAEAPRSDDTRDSAAKTSDAADSDTARIFVNVGKRDGVSAQAVRDILVGAELHPDDIDFIAVKDNHTFLGVASDLVDEVLQILNERAIGTAVARAEVARPRRR